MYRLQCSVRPSAAAASKACSCLAPPRLLAASPTAAAVGGAGGAARRSRSLATQSAGRQQSSSGGGRAKYVAFSATAGLAAAAGGTLLYADDNAEFRRWLEGAVPGGSGLFDRLGMGEHGSASLRARILPGLARAAPADAEAPPTTAAAPAEGHRDSPLDAANAAYEAAKHRLLELEHGVEAALHDGYEATKEKLASLEHSAEEALKGAWHAAHQLEERGYEASKAKLDEMQAALKRTKDKLVELEHSAAAQVGDAVASAKHAAHDTYDHAKASVKDAVGKVEQIERAALASVGIGTKGEGGEAQVEPAQLSDKERANKDLTERVRRALESAERCATEAVASKQAVGAAATEYNGLLRAAVQRELHADSKESSTWADLQHHHRELMRRAENDRISEQDADNYLDSLRKIIADGRSSPLTVHNALLDLADETHKDLTYRFEAARIGAKRAMQENVLMREYGQVVDQSRADFAAELRTLMPNVEFRARKEELSAGELNALLAHAHMKVDAMLRAAVEREAQRAAAIEEAVGKQQLADTKVADERVKAEIERLRAAYAADLESALRAVESDFRHRLQSELAAVAAEHERQLADGLEAARRQWDVETAQRVERATAKQRDAFEMSVAASLARVAAVESALDRRAQQDAENRRAKQLWLACQSLVDAVLDGREGQTAQQRRKPLANDLIPIREAAARDRFISAVFDSFSDEALFDGTYTRDDLAARFDKVRRVCARTAFVDAGGASLWHLLWSFAGSLLVFDLKRVYPADERRDFAAMGAHALLARARYHLEKRRDLETAVKLMQQLRGEPARAARDWIQDARRHLETLQAAEMLLTHAAATGMRTVY